MVSVCILCKYTTLNKDVSTHSFLKDPERRLLWLKTINRTTVSKNARLCSKHFEARFQRIFEQRRFLLPTAVPTLYLCTGNENDIEASNSQLTECSKPQINMNFINNATSNVVCPTTSEHEKIHNKSILTHNEMKTTSDRQDKLYNEEQMPLQNNVRRMENTEEGCELNQDQNSVYKKTNEDTQNNRKRNHYPGHIGVNSKRIKYIGDVDWNVVCHTPYEAKYYGTVAVKEIKALRKELNVRTQQIRDKNRKISNLQSLLTKLKEKDLIDHSSKETLSIDLNPLEEQIFNSILKRKRQQFFPPSLRCFAGTLHFLSPKPYKYVRKTVIKCLPHPKTISKWYMSVDGSPGISKPALDAIRRNVKKVKEQDKEIYCGLSIDDMPIKKQVEWNGKKLIGYIDYGIELNNDSLPEAKYAMVIMAVALNMHWKVPIAYYFIDGLSGIQRSEIVSQAIVALHETGINILVSITCDGASNNITMLNNLEANISLQKSNKNILNKKKKDENSNKKCIPSMSNVAINDQEKDNNNNDNNALLLLVENLKTYFPHPVTKENIWVILDACRHVRRTNCSALE